MRERLWHAVAQQLRHPHGACGGFAGHAMALVNAGPNRAALAALDVAPQDHVLELGFGPGRSLRALTHLAPRGQVTGVDASARMVRQATRRNRAAIVAGRLRVIEGPFAPLPLSSASVDKVLGVNVAYFFGAEARELAEVHRVLRPGGRVVLYATARATMQDWPLASSSTHRLLDADDLTRDFVAAGFCAADVEVTPLRLPFGVQGLIGLAHRA